MTHEQEAQAKPHYGFNEWYTNFKAQQKLLRLEDFRREDKIVLLEAELYNRIQDDDSIDDVVMAIEVLQANKVADEEMRRKQDSEIVAQVNGVIVFLIGVGITATIISYFSLPFCGRSHSKFCVGARVIPGYVADIFREPARVLPAKIKAD